MADNQTLQIVIKLTVDQASAQRVEQLLSRTRANIRAMGEEAKKLPLETVEPRIKRAFDPKLVERFNREMTELRRSIGDVGKESERTERRVSAMVSAYRQVQAAQRATGDEMPDVGDVFGRKPINLRTLGTDIKAMPAMPIPGTGFSTDVLGKMINTAGRLNIGLADLAIGFGVTAGAAAAISIAMKAFNETLAIGRANLEAALTAQRNYYEQVRKGDTESTQARLEELRELMKQEGAIIAESQNALNNAFRGAQEQFGDAFGRVAFAMTSGETNAQIDESIKRFNEYRHEYTRLNQAMANGTFTARDAAIAEEELAKARAANTRTNIDRLINAQTEAQKLAATGTSDQLKDRLETLGIEKKAILDNLKSAEQLAAETGDNSQVEALRKRLADIDTLVNTILFAGVGDVIAAREREAKAAEEAKERAEELAKSLDKVRDAEARADKSLADLNDKLADINEETNKRIAEAGAERAEAETEAQREADEARADAAREARKDAEENERDHQKRLLKIQKDYSRDSELAVQDRDAVALDAARQRLQEATDEENDEYKDRKRKVDDRLKETTAQIDRRLQEQNRKIVERYNDQIRAAYEYQAAQTRLANEAYQRQLADLRAALLQDINIRQSGYTAMLASANSFAAGLAAIAARLVNSAADAAAGGSATKGGGAKQPTPYARGLDAGMAMPFKDILVGEREPEILRLPRPGLVFTPQQYKQAANNQLVINFNGTRMTRREMVQQVDKAIGEWLS